MKNSVSLLQKWFFPATNTIQSVLFQTRKWTQWQCEITVFMSNGIQQTSKIGCHKTKSWELVTLLISAASMVLIMTWRELSLWGKSNLISLQFQFCVVPLILYQCCHITSFLWFFNFCFLWNRPNRKLMLPKVLIKTKSPQWCTVS